MEDFRKQPPVPLSPAAFKIPPVFETVLENGLKIVVLEDRRLPLVSFRLIFLAGDASEPPDAIGLNSALASMLNEGTENYSSKMLAEEIERLGASLGASSGPDNTRISASCLSFYVPDILRLMQELVLKPTFPQKELDLYKQNTIEGLKFQRSQAAFLANEQVSRILYGKHPYSIVSPSPQDVEKISREKLIEYHQKTFVPNNAIFIIVGDIDHREILKEVTEKFGDWQSGEVVPQIFPEIPERFERTLTIVNRKGSAQANVVLANPAIKRNHPDYFPVLVMNQILGAGASSRVFMNLREEKGYTYGAYTKFDMKRHAGEFEATAEVRTSVTGDSLREFFYELDKIRREKVSEEELLDAKNFLTGVFPIRAETQEGLTNLIVQQKIYNLPEDYLQTYRDNVSAVTIEDVQRVAEKYVQPEKIAIVIVGDAGEILTQVKEYANNIEVLDTEGNKLNVEDFEKKPEAPTIDLNGNWDLKIVLQGQELPVKLKITQQDAFFSGLLETAFGNGKIENGKISGNSFLGVATAEIQGQMLELTIDGKLENELIKGTISAPLIPEPLEIFGKKEF